MDLKQNYCDSHFQAMYLNTIPTVSGIQAGLARETEKLILSYMLKQEQSKCEKQGEKLNTFYHMT